MPLSTVRKVTLAISIVSAGLVVVAAIAARTTSKLVDDAEWVSRVRETRAKLLVLDNNLDHASDGVRAFLLTGDSAYLGRYRSSSDSVMRELAQLTALAAIDPSIGRTVDTLRSVVSEVHAELERTLARVGDARAGNGRGGSLHDGVRPTPTAAVDTLVARIEAVVYTLGVRADGLLAERASAQATREQIAWFIFLLLSAASIGVAIGAWRSVRRDLQRREQVELALRASEAKFAGILDIAADAIITVNEHNAIVHFNRGAEAVFGYAPSEVMGKPLDLLMPERFATAHRSRVEQFAQSSEPAHFVGKRPEIIGCRRGGQEFTAEASVSKLPTHDGVLFTAVLRDITERKRVERREHALSEAGARLSIPLDYEAQLIAVTRLPIGVIGNWCIVDVIEEGEGHTTSLRRVASVHPDPAVNATLRALEVGGLQLDSPERVIDVLRSGSPEIVTPVSHDWLEAHTIDAEQLALWEDLGSGALLLVPLQTRGRVTGAMTIGAAPGQTFDADDVALATMLAERGALAIDNAFHLRRAERASAARDRVLGVVSHDLRNFLSAITMSADSLRSAPPEFLTADRAAQIQNIIVAAGWMQRLMRDLLDVASIEAGRLSVQVEQQSVLPMVEAVREMIAARAGAQNVELRVDVPDSLPLVDADGERIVQVLANLAGNALKYTTAGGRISISARNAEREVVLSVQDTGAGIPAGDLPHVFDWFWHAKRSSTTRGTGLGLAIAQGIIAGHGGRIWVESEVGRGSTFSFSLPIAARRLDDDSASLESAAATADAARGQLASFTAQASYVEERPQS